MSDNIGTALGGPDDSSTLQSKGTVIYKRGGRYIWNAGTKKWEWNVGQ